jgi:hypothetical protein
MFIGHFAVGFASKRFAPRTNLAVLLAAPLLLDILWPFFVLFGWEQVRIDPGNTAFTPFEFVSYPWSHSLAMSMVWASLFAAIYFRLGLGLWNSIPATMAVELVLFAGGLFLYVMATQPRDRIGRYAFIAYTVLLLMAYFLDRLGGPPPSSINGDVIVPAIIAEAVLLPWAWWFDRHRALRQTQSATS